MSGVLVGDHACVIGQNGTRLRSFSFTMRLRSVYRLQAARRYLPPMDANTKAAAEIARWIDDNTAALRDAVYGREQDIRDRIFDLLCAAELAAYPELVDGFGDAHIDVAYRAACAFAS